jgi:hypothetical protein
MTRSGIQIHAGTTRTARPTAQSGTKEGRRPMNDFQAIADRVEIEALRGEYTDA